MDGIDHFVPAIGVPDLKILLAVLVIPRPHILVNGSTVRKFRSPPTRRPPIHIYNVLKGQVHGSAHAHSSKCCFSAGGHAVSSMQAI